MKKQTEEERLNWLKTRLRSVAEGASLLDFAEKNNIPIRFDPTLLRREGFAGTYNFRKKVILLSPQYWNRFLITTLAHELRHAWQDSVLEFDKREELKPRDYLLSKRLTEGDAHAFQNYMKRKLRLQNAPSFVKKSPAFIRIFFGYAEPDFQKDMEAGFVKFQKSFIAPAYDADSLRYLKTRWLRPAKGLSEVFNTASSLAPPTSAEQPGFLYMGAKTMDDLAEKIYQHIPESTRKKVAAL